MNTKTLKGIGATLALLAGMCVATPALSTSTGEQRLGAEGKATDTQNPVDAYAIVCEVHDGFPILLGALFRVEDSGPIVAHNHLVVVAAGVDTGIQVVDLSPASLFQPEGSPFHVRIPLGDSPGASEYVRMRLGLVHPFHIRDQYVAVVKKTGPEAEGYVLEMQCEYKNEDNTVSITDPISFDRIIDQ
jgi:hypothetical protein